MSACLLIVTGSSPRGPGRTDGNEGRGLRSVLDLTQHLTTRADDSHAVPVWRPAELKDPVSRIRDAHVKGWRSEEHTSELQSLMRISYAVFCLKKKTRTKRKTEHNNKHNQQQQHKNHIK